MAQVKICGVRTATDALACVELGASAIGINFIPESPRYVDIGTARAIARAVHGVGTRLRVVGVVANLSAEAMRVLARDAELDLLQLHGDESAEELAAVLPYAYKAIRVASVDDVARARAYGGADLLVDAKVEGALGGTGRTFDWSLVTALAKERRLTLAGGLTPANVSAAVRAVRPFCVDVASGVEHSPGHKNWGAVRTFISAARLA